MKSIAMSAFVDDIDFAQPFKARILNILQNACIGTIADLIERSQSELLGLPGLGKGCCDEIVLALSRHGLSLKSNRKQFARVKPTQILESEVVSAAVAWWTSHRPSFYSEEQHLNNPVFDLNAADSSLAEAVARLIKGRKVT